jgi:Tfp pilus assembly protein PilO
MITANRIWIAGAVIVALGIVALGWLLGVQPQLDARTSAQDARAAVASTNQQAATRAAQLAKEAQNTDQLTATNDTLKKSVPSAADVPAFVDEVNSAAEAAGVVVTGISVAAAQPYQAPTAAASGSSATTATPAPSAAATPAAGMPPFTDSRINDKTMAVIPVTIDAKGEYLKVLDFVKALQTGERYYLATGISTSADTSGDQPTGAVTAELTGSIFALTPTS